MVELAVADVEGLTASSFEVERGGYPIRIDTMKELQDIEPEAEFSFIIGADMVDMIPAWYQIDELVKLVKFIGVRRPGSEGKTKYPM